MRDPVSGLEIRGYDAVWNGLRPPLIGCYRLYWRPPSNEKPPLDPMSNEKPPLDPTFSEKPPPLQPPPLPPHTASNPDGSEPPTSRSWKLLLTTGIPRSLTLNPKP
jgi:hypothetical protein